MKFSLLSATLAFLTIYQWSPQYVIAASCTITKYDADDIKRAQEECTQIKIDGIEVPAGETLTLTNLRPGTNVIFSGTITWAYKEWEGPLISVAGVNVDISGETGHVLDGRGSMWWNGTGRPGGKLEPKLFEVKLTGSQIHHLNIKNSPGHIFSINDCNNLEVTLVTVDNSAGDGGGALNTDAFIIGSSSDIKIHSCRIFNQGNCLSITCGSNMKFTNNYCSGGQGISIGSGIGAHIVADITISDCEVTNSDNGIKIWTAYGAPSTIANIKYRDITLSSIRKYGIVIEGDYKDGIPTGTPYGGASVSNVKANNIHGTVNSSGVNIYVLLQGGSDWQFSKINITGGTKNKPCTGIPNGAGISC